jgi:hypothetical protein
MKKDLKSMNFQELKVEMIERYDGNAGEIILGLEECGFRGKKLNAALVRYMEKYPPTAEK